MISWYLFILLILVLFVIVIFILDCLVVILGNFLNFGILLLKRLLLFGIEEFWLLIIEVLGLFGGVVNIKLKFSFFCIWIKNVWVLVKDFGLGW